MIDNFFDKIKGNFMKILLDRYNELSKKEYKYPIPHIIKEAKQKLIDDK